MKTQAETKIEPAAAGAGATGDDEIVTPAAGDGSGGLSDEELVAGLEAEEKAAGEPETKGEKKPDEKKPTEKKEGEPEIEVKLDAAASKSIEATKRYRTQVERELQAKAGELAKRETELAGRLAKADAYEKAVAARDPVAVAEALGWGDDLEGFAHTVYKLSKSASPVDRAAAAQLIRQRQAGSEVDVLKKELADLKTTLQQQQVKAEQQQFVAQYTSQLQGAVSAEQHPLVANALKNAPKEARQELLQVAARLEQANNNETPEPAEVLKAYESALRRQAQALGFDPSTIGKQHGTTTTPTPETGQKKTTATLTSDLGPQTRSRSAPKSLDEGFDETARELEEMDRAKGRRA